MTRLTFTAFDAFAEAVRDASYGLSSQEYFRVQRLYKARRLLRASCQDRTTVTHVLGKEDVLLHVVRRISVKKQ